MRAEQTKRHRSLRRSGLFITFEGIEGSGKTTQCHQLTLTLRAEGYRVIETREPGGTPIAEKIRNLFLQGPFRTSDRESLTPECEANLIFACRSQHLTHIITPALLKGTIVICDRFSDSTLAYQGYGRGLELEKLQALNQFATVGLIPDLTFLFDLPVNLGLSRRKRTKKQNRLDLESQAFHKRVRRGFMCLAQQNPGRIVLIDARKSPETIASEVAKKTAMFIATTQLSPPGVF